MPLIESHAHAVGLDPALVRAVVTAESSGDPQARSPVGAHGLMQITPITLRDVLQRNPDLPAGDLFDPDYNLRIGTRYLAYLIKRFDHDVTLALMAYHMGPTAVRRLQRRHPGQAPQDLLASDGVGPQTRAYLRRIQAMWSQ